MEEALVKRIMPNSLEAEQSVIGSMIMDKEAIMTAGEILIEEDFYHKQYGILFESMLDLFNAGEPVDLITLQNKFKRKGCAGGNQQPGICKRLSNIRTDIRQCKILCQYRQREGSSA